MSDWTVTWFDYGTIRSLTVPCCDIHYAIDIATGRGAQLNNIISVAREPVKV